MDLAWSINEYIEQDKLLFGIDNVRAEGEHGGNQYAGMSDEQMYSAQYSQQHYSHTSPFLQSPSYPQLSCPPAPALGQHQSFPPHITATYGDVSFWDEQPAQNVSHNSFLDGCEALTTFPEVAYVDWDNGNTFQNSPNSLSSPVDIPVHMATSVPNEVALLSPAETVDSFGLFGPSSLTSSIMSRTFSETSCDTAMFEESSQLFPALATSLSPCGSLGNSPPLGVIQYLPNTLTHRLKPHSGVGKRTRGRSGPLNETQRKNTAKMRLMGACPSCHARKAKCDPGFPCRQCISYYKDRLIHHPCRGLRLEHVAGKLLRGHIFPRKRDVGKDLGVQFTKWPTEINVYLELGFGDAFEWPAQVVCPNTSPALAPELVHQHIVYNFPAHYDMPRNRKLQKQKVFPAVLVREGELKGAIDKHLTKITGDPKNFKFFPLYRSPLDVLRHIYDYYLKVTDPNSRALLGKAFKLLNLIHIGGHTRLSPGADSQKIIQHFFPPDTREQDVTPCFIRGQLGEVFAKLAHEYMREVLSELESECLKRQSAQFPVVVSTFLVLCMAIESIQYHTHADTFHLPQDGIAASSGLTNDEIDGMEDLLRFYKNCVGECHWEQLLGPRLGQSEGGPGLTPLPGDLLVRKLRDALNSSRPYLMKRSKENLSTKEGDITVFFDRLSARLLLLEG